MLPDFYFFFHTGANVSFGNFWRIFFQMLFDILVFLLTQCFLNVKLLWLVSGRIWVYAWIPRYIATILFYISRIIWTKAEALLALGWTSLSHSCFLPCAPLVLSMVWPNTWFRKVYFTRDIILINTIVVEEHQVNSPCRPDCTSVWN